MHKKVVYVYKKAAADKTHLVNIKQLYNAKISKYTSLTLGHLRISSFPASYVSEKCLTSFYRFQKTKAFIIFIIKELISFDI